MKKYQSYLVMLLAGLIYTLGHPNVVGILLPFTPILGTSLLLHFLLKSRRPLEAVKCLLTFNLIITLFSFYWITNTLQEFGNLPFIVAAIANLGFALIFCPQYWVLIVLIFLIKKYKPRLEFLYFRDGLFSVCLASLMTFLEYFIPQQFPIMLGQPWIILGEHLGLAQIFGIPIYSFVSYLLAIEFIRYYKVRRLSYFNIASIIVVAVLSSILGLRHAAKQASTAIAQETPNFNIRVVQANISNFLKVDSESGNYASTEEVLNAYKELSLAPSTLDEPLDLIIWPETAYPYPITVDKSDISSTILPPLFEDIAVIQNSELLIGGYNHKEDSTDLNMFQTEFNAAFHVGRNQKLKKTFHKHILIPFGETLPLGPFNKTVSNFVPEMAFFAEGKKFPLFESDKKISFITTICYELIKPEFIREYLNSVAHKPDFLINLTNDSWYGDTVEPEQHLFLARWRSLEFDLPIIRSTNTGISTVIDTDGREIKRLNYYKTGNLDIQMQVGPRSAPTLFQRFGFWLMLPLWGFYFLFHIIWLKLKYAKNTH